VTRPTGKPRRPRARPFPRVNVGEANPMAKLTWRAVRAIRRRARHGAAPSELAAEYGIDRTNVHRILRGDAWREPEPKPCVIHVEVAP
jgi:hypothetical protein